MCIHLLLSPCDPGLTLHQLRRSCFIVRSFCLCNTWRPYAEESWVKHVPWCCMEVAIWVLFSESLVIMLETVNSPDKTALLDGLYVVLFFVFFFGSNRLWTCRISLKKRMDVWSYAGPCIILHHTKNAIAVCSAGSELNPTLHFPAISYLMLFVCLFVFCFFYRSCELNSLLFQKSLLVILGL